MDNCIIAPGTTVKGYALKCYEGVQWPAHRLAWTLANGPIPEGLHVLHTCDVRNCINIDHLWLGTNEDNMRDKISKNRQARGITHANSKLDEEKVREIRKRGKTELYSTIAKDYGVTKMTINDVMNGYSWGWVK